MRLFRLFAALVVFTLIAPVLWAWRRRRGFTLAAALLFLGLSQVSCATLKQDLKPFPGQSAACFKAEATVSNAVGVATCVAQGGGQAMVEACFQTLGEHVGLAVLTCEGGALWLDLHHAKVVAQVTGLPTATVQANAADYLNAKGVAVSTAPSAPPAP